MRAIVKACLYICVQTIANKCHFFKLCSCLIKNIIYTPKLKKMYYGKPTYFNPEKPIEKERRRISEYLMDEITRIACELPEHIVIPYDNFSADCHQTNIPKEQTHEKARS